MPETETSVPETSSAAPLPAVKVIGNRDSKFYHLPGMRYYNQISPHHRVEFASEQQAVAAGYRKAPK